MNVALRMRERCSFCYLLPCLLKTHKCKLPHAEKALLFSYSFYTRSTPVFLSRGRCRKRAFTDARSVVVCKKKLHTVDVSVTEEEQVKRLIGNKISQLRNDGHSLLEKSISLGIVQPGRYELSVVFCSDNYIRLLNNNWRNLNEPTDVLSFAQEDDTLLGDIVISTETAYKQSLERNYSLTDEIRVLLVHGFLHLIGYDHEEDEERRREMEQLETKLLSSLEWKGKGLVALS
jgi:rRNA maturation RNase YbeY